MAEIVIDFFDALKSRTKGYASLDYEPAGYVTSDVVRVDLLINHEPGRRFLHHRAPIERRSVRTQDGRAVERTHPASNVRCADSSCHGGRVVARQTVKARRKDVLAKCYGGDITRKRKLLEKQKEGKKRMKNLGRVEVPQEAFVAALKLED